MSFSRFILFCVTVIILSGCGNTPVNHIPNGGHLITIREPIWFSGIKDPVNESFSTEYPDAVESEYISVVNSGYWLANAYGKRSQLIYEFTVNFKNLTREKYYTRMILENPLDKNAPFIYEHYINSEEQSTKGTHGPLEGVRLGTQYQMTIELYEDKERSILVDRVSQLLLSSVGNQSGCVEITDEYKSHYFSNVATLTGNNYSPEKLVIYCDK